MEKEKLEKLYELIREFEDTIQPCDDSQIITEAGRIIKFYYECEYECEFEEPIP